MTTYGSIGVRIDNLHTIEIGDSSFETFMYFPYMQVQISKIKLNIVTLTEQVSIKSLQLTPDVPVNSLIQEDQKIYPTAFWKFDYFNQHSEKRSPIPKTNGYIKGTVKVEGVLYGDIPVRLYHRDTGTKIAHTVSDENGEYQFDGICPDIPEYLVCSILDGFETVYNASTLDKVSAVKYVYPDTTGISNLPTLAKVADFSCWADVQSLSVSDFNSNEIAPVYDLSTGIYVSHWTFYPKEKSFSALYNTWNLIISGYFVQRNRKSILRLSPNLFSSPYMYPTKIRSNYSYNRPYTFFSVIEIKNILYERFLLVTALGTENTLDPNFPDYYYLFGEEGSSVPAMRLPNDFEARFTFYFEDGTSYTFSQSGIPSAGTIYSKLAYTKFIMVLRVIKQDTPYTLDPIIGCDNLISSVLPLAADIEISDFFIYDGSTTTWREDIILSTMAWKHEMSRSLLSLDSTYYKFKNSPPTRDDINISYASLSVYSLNCTEDGVTFKTSCVLSSIFVPVQKHLIKNANTYMEFSVYRDGVIGLFRHKSGKDIIPLNDYFPGGPSSDSFWDEDIVVYGYRTSDGALMINKYIYPGVFPVLGSGTRTFKIAYNASTGKVFIGEGATWFNGGDPVTLANPAFTINLTDPNQDIYPFIQMSSKNDSLPILVKTSYLTYQAPTGYRLYNEYGPQ